MLKKVVLSIIVSVLMLFNVNAFALPAGWGLSPGTGTAAGASGVMSGILLPVGLGVGLAYLAGSRDAQGLPGACYNEPDHLVKWKDAPGYSFTMGGCDYVAKKDLVTTLN